MLILFTVNSYANSVYYEFICSFCSLLSSYKIYAVNIYANILVRLLITYMKIMYDSAVNSCANCVHC
jgi:hypothetical protein